MSKNQPTKSIEWAAIKTPIGKVFLGASSKGICNATLEPSQAKFLAELSKQNPKAIIKKMKPAAAKNYGQIIQKYLTSKNSKIRANFDVAGTPFQQKVWSYLQTIPCGKTMSYAQVAKGIQKPRAVRAVANAVASNHVALLIPCHRVIRSDNTIGGYRWGKKIKSKLLEIEEN